MSSTGIHANNYGQILYNGDGMQTVSENVFVNNSISAGTPIIYSDGISVTFTQTIFNNPNATYEFGNGFPVYFPYYPDNLSGNYFGVTSYSQIWPRILDYNLGSGRLPVIMTK